MAEKSNTEKDRELLKIARQDMRKSIMKIQATIEEAELQQKANNIQIAKTMNLAEKKAEKIMREAKIGAKMIMQDCKEKTEAQLIQTRTQNEESCREVQTKIDGLKQLQDEKVMDIQNVIDRINKTIEDMGQIDE